MTREARANVGMLLSLLIAIIGAGSLPTQTFAEPEFATVVASFASPGSSPAGLAWNGQYLWNGDYETHRIYKLNPSTGSVITSFSSPGVYPFGLAWDGQYLWCADSAADRIYKIDVASTIEGTQVDAETKYWEAGNYQLRIIAQASPGDVSSITITGPSYLDTATVNKPGDPESSDNPKQLYDDGQHWDGEDNDGLWWVELNIDGTPTKTDTITFHITYTDGSTETKQKTIDGVLSQTAQLLSPSDGSTVYTLTPKFEWSNPPISGLTYSVQVNDSWSRVYEVYDLPEGTTSHRIPSGHLNWATTYYWLISASDVNGNEALTNWDTFTTVAPLEKQVKTNMAGMTVSYNWVDETNGEDIYHVSKIHAWTFAAGTGVADFSITGGDVTIWRDVWIIPSGVKAHTYVSPFTPTNRWWELELGSQFGVAPKITNEGIEVRASDKMNVRTRGLQYGPPGPGAGPWIPSPNVDTASTTFHPDAPVELTTLFTPLENVWNWIAGKLFSPSEIRVYDTQGRITGLVNGEVREEIPYSAYNDNMFIILLPSDLFTYEVAGIDEGSYGLGITSPEEEEVTHFIAHDIPISTGAIHHYTVDWDALSKGEEGVTVQMDNNGDGTFELTFTTGSTLLFVPPTIDIDPDTLNLKSKGQWITCYIELPEGYDVNSIDISTIELKVGENKVAIVAEDSPSELNDYDEDGIPDLMVKFDRAALIDYIKRKALSGEVTLTIVGGVNNKLFAGTDTIKIEGAALQLKGSPPKFGLSQNYPNPCNPETTIEYGIEKNCQVTLKIYNIAGQLIKTLVDEHQTAGHYAITWYGDTDTGGEVASGIYFYRIKAGDFVSTKKMVVLK